jgi:lipopolysaccharide export system protein LptA
MRVEWLISCLLLLAMPAYAEKADKGKPVNLEADSVRVEDTKKTAVYEGHVVLTQGTLMMTADKIDVQQDEQGFSSGDAIGKPVYFRQKMEGRDEIAEGWAERIVYDGRTDKLKLSGQARLRRGEEELRGNQITYDGKSEFYQALGSGDGVRGRVHAVIPPKAGATANPPKPASAQGGKP